MEFYNRKKIWLYSGLIWGFFMYIFNVLILPILKDKENGMTEYLVNIPIWIIVGIGFGYFLKIYPDKKKKKQKV